MSRQHQEPSLVGGFVTPLDDGFISTFSRQLSVRSSLPAAQHNSFPSNAPASSSTGYPPRRTGRVPSAALPTDDSNTPSWMPPTPRMLCISLPPSSVEGLQYPYEASTSSRQRSTESILPATNQHNIFPVEAQASTSMGNPPRWPRRGRPTDLPADDSVTYRGMPPTPKLPYAPLPPSPVQALQYPSETDSMFTMSPDSAVGGYVVSAVMENTPLDLLLGITSQLEIDRSYGMNIPIAEVTLRISASNEQAIRASYRQVCNTIDLVTRLHSKHLSSITILLPRDCPIGMLPISDHPRSTVDLFSLRKFVWEGPLELLPNALKCLPFNTVEQLSITHGRISIPDCLEILRNAPRVEELELHELADAPPVFGNIHRHQTRIALGRLTSLMLASSIDHRALFAAIKIDQLLTAHLSFSSHHAVKIPPSIPWGKMFLLTLDAPCVDAGLVDSVMTKLGDCSEGTRHITINVNNKCVVSHGRRTSMAPYY